MITRYLKSIFLAVGAATMAATAAPAAGPPPLALDWATVVNNTDVMPGACVTGTRTFNSYNQPSVNAAGLVVIRARSTGGPPCGPATHGIYTRDMSVDGRPIFRILDRSTQVPQPNNWSTKFVETPSFPRIDIWSNTIATRGNHQPVWFVSEGGADDGAYGTTGIYANPFGTLVTGASKLGVLPEFGFFEVPGASPGTPFDVFPGSPSVTNGRTIVFKGNYTVGGAGKTGVFYRNLENDVAGGTSPVMLIANNTDTVIPGSKPSTVFGSTSPPSAAGKFAVFAGFDNEENPALGGLYLVEIQKPKYLKPLVKIGARVPGGGRTDTFNRLGEAVAFDGRYVGFWGAWNAETEYRTVRLYCPTEGNKDRMAYCNRNLICYENGIPTGAVEKDPYSVCDATSCYQEKHVPVRQGIFLYDTEAQTPWVVAKTGDAFEDFVYWNYSGKSPCTGKMGHGQEGAEDDGEPARWRSSSFVAVSGGSTAFKASAGEVSGIYLNICSNPAKCSIFTVLDTTMDGQYLDPEAEGSTITELGLEREGLRDGWLAVNARMGIEGGNEEEGMAGVYVTRVR